MSNRSTPNAVLTFARAVELLSYDVDSGAIRWLDSRKNALSGGNAGCIVKGKYRRIRIDGIDYQAHRVAWLLLFGKWPDGDIDHLNGCQSDNRACNLRDVPRAINSQNQATGRRGGLIGASFHPASQKWRAIIGLNGKYKTIGYYSTELEAHEAYIATKRVMHPGSTI